MKPGIDIDPRRLYSTQEVAAMMGYKDEKAARRALRSLNVPKFGRVWSGAQILKALGACDAPPAPASERETFTTHDAAPPYSAGQVPPEIHIPQDLGSSRRRIRAALQKGGKQSLVY